MNVELLQISKLLLVVLPFVNECVETHTPTFVGTQNKYTDWTVSNFSIPAETIHILHDPGLRDALLGNMPGQDERPTTVTIRCRW